MFYMQVVHVASEVAGGEVWSLCEKQVCLKGEWQRDDCYIQKAHW